MENLNFFDSIDYLEPHCPKCKSKIEYGVSTRFNDEQKAHVCVKCGTVLK